MKICKIKLNYIYFIKEEEEEEEEELEVSFFNFIYYH